MTDHEIEKLQRGIEASLRDLNALNFGATIVESGRSATIIVKPKVGYESNSEPREQQKVADRLRMALIGRGYRVETELINPATERDSYSFRVRAH